MSTREFMLLARAASLYWGMMANPPALMRELAERLLTAEAVNKSAPHTRDAVRVCEKLRVSLTRFAGADGFTSLMRRALSLAQAEIPALRSVHIKGDGSLEGIEKLAADANSSGTEAAAIIAQLLGLLVTFVGEPITLRLVREAWPDASLHQ